MSSPGTPSAADGGGGGEAMTARDGPTDMGIDEPTYEPSRWNVSYVTRRALERSFATNPYPKAAERARLASEFDVSQRQIQIWFQNRRQRVRKPKSAKKEPVRTSQPAAEHALRSERDGATSAAVASEGAPAPRSPKTITCVPAMLGGPRPHDSALVPQTTEMELSAPQPSPFALDARAHTQVVQAQAQGYMQPPAQALAHAPQPHTPQSQPPPPPQQMLVHQYPSYHPQQPEQNAAAAGPAYMISYGAPQQPQMTVLQPPPQQQQLVHVAQPPPPPPGPAPLQQAMPQQSLVQLQPAPQWVTYNAGPAPQPMPPGAFACVPHGAPPHPGAQVQVQQQAYMLPPANQPAPTCGTAGYVVVHQGQQQDMQPQQHTPQAAVWYRQA